MTQIAEPAVALATPSRVRFGVLGWFCSLSMITYIDRVCIMQVQGEMQRDLELSPQQFALAFSAFALAYAMFEVPTGWLGDRIGPRKVLIRIVLCWLLFTALTGLVFRFELWPSLRVFGVPLLSGYMMLLAVRFLFGAGEAGAYPNIARGAKNWFPFAERGRAQGMVWTFGRWGGALAPVLIVALAWPFDYFHLLPGWRGAFLMLGLLGVLWVIGFARSFHETPRGDPRVNAAELNLIEEGSAAVKPAPICWASILTSPTLWCLSVMYFCSNAGWSFFITYVSPFLKEDLRMSGWKLHFASGAPLFFGGIGCLLGGFLTDRQVRVWGRRWGRTLQGLIAYFTGGVFFLAAVLLTGFARDQPADTRYVLVLGAFTALCLASLVKDLAMAASWSTTIDIGHRYSGTVAGVMNTIGNLGTVFSPPIVAYLAVRAGTPEQPSYGIPLVYYAFMFFVASVCWLFINPRRVIVYSREDRERLQAEGVLR
jgi:MFS family permease